mmetsp:Transcript_40565/g.127878  ORF Transcript_40565/g.127878 Transcript_40565/m.127878 type:complete len:252 (-) Transcript_40565:465-1220(-)
MRLAFRLLHRPVRSAGVLPVGRGDHLLQPHAGSDFLHLLALLLSDRFDHGPGLLQPTPRRHFPADARLNHRELRVKAVDAGGQAHIGEVAVLEVWVGEEEVSYLLDEGGVVDDERLYGRSRDLEDLRGVDGGVGCLGGAAEEEGEAAELIEGLVEQLDPLGVQSDRVGYGRSPELFDALVLPDAPLHEDKESQASLLLPHHHLPGLVLLERAVRHEHRHLALGQGLEEQRVLHLLQHLSHSLHFVPRLFVL